MSLVSRVASDLNDNEDGHAYTTWTEEQIGAWIVEGANLIYDKRPDLFLENKIIQVEPCSITQDVCSCDIVRRVIGQCTESGRLIKPLPERGLEISFQWSGKPCHRTSMDTVSLDSYAIDTVSGQLYLWPEVPPSVDVYILVECSMRPSTYDGIEDVGGTLDAAIIQWALWRAKSMDMEISSSAMNAAKVHYQAFFDIIEVSVGAQTIVHKRDKT